MATNDLVRIDAYLSQIDADIADGFNDALLPACEFLLDRIHAGPVVRAGIRKWPIGNSDYLLLYRVVDDGITTLRARHGRENWRESS